MDNGRRQEQQQSLLARRRSFSNSSDERYSAEHELDALDEAHKSSPSSPRRSWWRRGTRVAKAHPRPWRRRSLAGRACYLFSWLPYIVGVLVITYGIFLPSYSHPPQRYTDLRKRVVEAKDGASGAANPHNEKVFIAASLYDKEGALLSGDWGESVKRLAEILGKDNVFISVYENDQDDKSKAAMDKFRADLPCKSAIVHEHLDKSELPHVTMQDGSQPLQRIAFLADVRNRALRPLDDSRMDASKTRWDKLLYINDVSFDPIDAANLLFSTHVSEKTGKADYRAACAVDFINPFKFYDTFATRDTDGYDMGVPFYPWFTGAGNGTSRKDVLSQTDAVRVKSCWGGMVAFEAKWFQPHLYEFRDGDLVVPSSPDEILENNLEPLHFRAETDTYWDASECCLIHADLSHLSHLALAEGTSPALETADGESGIYMNPYVRVAYDASTLGWLSYTRRFERLYPFIQTLVNIIGSRPGYNPRQFQQPGDRVTDEVWKWNQESEDAIKNGKIEDLKGGLKGGFVKEERIAGTGMFCGGRKLLYFTDDRKPGQPGWDTVTPPTV